MITFFQFLPKKIQFKILTKTRFSRLKKWDEQLARNYTEEIRLMTQKELKEIFPKSNIFYEKFLGMTKSFTVHTF